MAKVEIEINGKDNASGAIKGVTGSIITASLAVEAIKKGFQILSDTVKNSINEFREAEQGQARLKTQLGGNIEEFNKFANSIQRTTTLEDDQITSMQTLAGSIGITREKINDATKSAIGLSEAFGIDLNQALKMVSQAQNGNFNMLNRVIPEMQNAGTQAERMAILQEKAAAGFDLATAKAATFTGGLDQLKNINGDNLEAFGKIVSVVGIDIVNAMKNGANALNNFLTNTKVISSIGAGFETFKKIVMDIGSNVFKRLEDAIKPVVDLWKDLTKNLDGGKASFSAISIAVGVMNAGLNMVVGFVKLNIQAWVDWVKTLIEAGKTIEKVFELITGKAKWDDVKKQFAETGSALKTLAGNVADNTKAIVVGATEDIKKIFTESKKNADEYNSYYLQKKKELSDKLEKESNDSAEKQKKVIGDINGKGEKGAKSFSEKWAESWKAMSSDEKASSVINMVSSAFSKIAGIIGQAMSLASEAMQAQLDNQITSIDEWKENSLASVDEWVQEQYESQGLVEENTTASTEKEIGDLEAKIAKTHNVKKKAELKEQLEIKKEELAKQKIKEQAELKKAQIEEEAEKKTTAAKKKSFEEQKKMQIAMIWVNAAAGAIGAVAQGVSQLGPLAGAIVGAAEAAIILAMAGVQTGIVNAQTYSGEQGGIIPTGAISGDTTMLRANKDEVLLRDDTYKNMVNMVNQYAEGDSSGGNQSINIYLDGELIERSLIERQKNARIK